MDPNMLVIPKVGPVRKKAYTVGERMASLITEPQVGVYQEVVRLPVKRV